MWVKLACLLTIQALEPRIKEIVVECLAPTKGESVFDITKYLAKPLPAIVIAEMMGLPESDRSQFQGWSEDLVVATGTSDARKTEQARRSGRELINYFREMISSRRGNPGDDLIGQLILAGHETTTRLIGNGVFCCPRSLDCGIS